MAGGDRTGRGEGGFGATRGAGVGRGFFSAGDLGTIGGGELPGGLEEGGGAGGLEEGGGARGLDEGGGACTGSASSLVIFASACCLSRCLIQAGFSDVGGATLASSVDGERGRRGLAAGGGGTFRVGGGEGVDAPMRSSTSEFCRPRFRAFLINSGTASRSSSRPSDWDWVFGFGAGAGPVFLSWLSHGATCLPSSSSFSCCLVRSRSSIASPRRCLARWSISCMLMPPPPPPPPPDFAFGGGSFPPFIADVFPLAFSFDGAGRVAEVPERN